MFDPDANITMPHPAAHKANLDELFSPGSDELLSEATRHAESIAIAIHGKHFPEIDQWKPHSGDLIGLLTQIDNMTASMKRARKSEPAFSGWWA